MRKLPSLKWAVLVTVVTTSCSPGVILFLANPPGTVSQWFFGIVGTISAVVSILALLLWVKEYFDQKLIVWTNNMIDNAIALLRPFVSLVNTPMNLITMGEYFGMIMKYRTEAQFGSIKDCVVYKMLEESKTEGKILRKFEKGMKLRRKRAIFTLEEWILWYISKEYGYSSLKAKQEPTDTSPSQ